MKNKKGFVLSTYVYILLVFFLLLLSTMLAVLNNTRILSNKLKEQSSSTSGLSNKDFSFVLLGDKEMVLFKGGDFIDPGYKIQNTLGMDLSQMVKVTGSVNSDVIGTYELTYTATYNGVTKTISRNVEVVGTAVEKIERLATASNTEGLITDDTDDNNIRYTGSSPKNYIKFNNELWRIIGVFNVTTASEKTEKLVKIIRDTSIGRMSWDSSESIENQGKGVNEWSEAGLNIMLNTYYIGTSTTCSYCDSYNQGTCSNDCSSSVNQIGSTYRELIEEVVWNTGAIKHADSVSRSSAYNQERGTITGKNNCSGQYCTDTVTRTKIWIGKVGLIYPSDYGYASTSGTDIRSASIGTTNWLNNKTYYWTISPYASDIYSTSAWNAYPDGFVYANYTCGNFEIRPTLYLKSNVIITSGDGSSSNPYQISMNI